MEKERAKQIQSKAEKVLKILKGNSVADVKEILYRAISECQKKTIMK